MKTLKRYRNRVRRTYHKHNRKTKRKTNRKTKRKTKRKMKGGMQYPELNINKSLLEKNTIIKRREPHRELTIFGFWIHLNKFPIQIESIDEGGDTSEGIKSLLSHYESGGVRGYPLTLTNCYLVSVNGKNICEKSLFYSHAPETYQDMLNYEASKRTILEKCQENEDPVLKLIFDDAEPRPLVEKTVNKSKFTVGLYVNLCGAYGVRFNVENLLDMYQRGLIYDPPLPNQSITDFVYNDDGVIPDADFEDYFYKCRGELGNSLSPRENEEIMRKHRDNNRCIFVIIAHGGISGLLHGTLPENTDLISLTHSTTMINATSVMHYIINGEKKAFCINRSALPYRKGTRTKKISFFRDIYDIAKSGSSPGDYLFVEEDGRIVPNRAKRYLPLYYDNGAGIPECLANIPRLYTHHDERIHDTVLSFEKSSVFASVPFMPQPSGTDANTDFGKDIGCWLQDKKSNEFKELQGSETITFSLVRDPDTGVIHKTVEDVLPVSTGITIFSPPLESSHADCILELHMSLQSLLRKGGVITKPIIREGDQLKCYTPGGTHLEQDGFIVISGINGHSFLTETPPETPPETPLRTPPETQIRPTTLEELPRHFLGKKMYIMIRFPDGTRMNMSDLCIECVGETPPIFKEVPGTWYSFSCKSLLQRSKDVIREIVDLPETEGGQMTPLTRMIKEMSGRRESSPVIPEFDNFTQKFLDNYFPYQDPEIFGGFIHKDIVGEQRKLIMSEICDLLITDFYGKGFEHLRCILHNPSAQDDLTEKCKNLNDILGKYKLWVIGGKFVVDDNVLQLIDCLCQVALVKGKIEDVEKHMEELFNLTTVELANMLFNEESSTLDHVLEQLTKLQEPDTLKPEYRIITEPGKELADEKERIETIEVVNYPLAEFIHRMWPSYELRPEKNIIKSPDDAPRPREDSADSVGSATDSEGATDISTME